MIRKKKGGIHPCSQVTVPSVPSTGRAYEGTAGHRKGAPESWPQHRTSEKRGCIAAESQNSATGTWWPTGEETGAGRLESPTSECGLRARIVQTPEETRGCQEASEGRLQGQTSETRSRNPERQGPLEAAHGI